MSASLEVNDEDRETVKNITSFILNGFTDEPLSILMTSLLWCTVSVLMAYEEKDRGGATGLFICSLVECMKDAENTGSLQ